MGLHRILYLTDQGLIVFRREKGWVREEARFSPDPEGQTRYARFLDLAPGRYDLLWDLGQEVYREEALPRLRGKERQQLVLRKLAQHFPHSPFRGALPLGISRLQREEESFLFLALTAPEVTQAWVAPLEARQLPVGQITCLPLILARLVRQGWLPGQGLLLTRQEARLRQSYFAQGQLHFSRQVTLPAGPEAWPQLLRETAHCHQYLLGQRLLERHQPLAVHLLSLGEEGPEGRAEGQEPPWCRLDATALARHLGASPASPSITLPQLWAQALVRKPPSTAFAPAALGQTYRWQRWERTLVGAGAGSFCLGLALGALDLGEARQWQQIATANQQALIASPGPLPTVETQSPAPPSVPPTLLARLEQLEEQRPDPRRLFHQLSGLLDRTPGLRLTRLEWTGEEAGEAPSPLSASTKHPLPQGPHLALEGEIQEEEDLSPVRREADFATPLNQFRAALEANAQLQGRIQGDATGSSPAFRGEIWSRNKP